MDRTLKEQLVDAGGPTQPRSCTPIHPIELGGCRGYAGLLRLQCPPPLPHPCLLRSIQRTIRMAAHADSLRCALTSVQIGLARLPLTSSLSSVARAATMRFRFSASA